ncbi:MAG: hypothetical protein ACLFQ7_03745 [Phormidium sp.]
MNQNLKFELLVLDTNDQSVIESEVNLLHSLLSVGSLWNASQIDTQNLTITDGEVTLEAKRLTADEASGMDINKTFLITASGSYKWLEPGRKRIVEYLKNQGFDFLYILEDQVSESIAKEIYPRIYQVENLLRAYIVKFMTTRLGPKWWAITATNDLKQKVNNRKNNEKEFSPYIANDAYLIDFGDLGQLIYAHSSGFTSKEDILKKVFDLEETPEAIQTLKQDLQSNYKRFFEESFKDKKFQEKWEKLEKIRHKVAHNNLFTHGDLNQGKELTEDLLKIINTAIESVDQVTLRSEEKQAIQNSFSSRQREDISEVELLEELRQQEDHYLKRSGGFVGLSNFVREHLSSYDTSSAYDLIRELEDKGKVEVYPVDNPYGGNQTSAIRSLSEPST